MRHHEKTSLVIASVWAAVLGFAVVAPAQDRLPPIPAEKMTAEQKKAVADFKAARGANAAMNGPWIPLLRSPEVMMRARAMGDYLRYDTVLPPRLSEFVILIAASQWAQQYEWATHYPIAVKEGMSQETGIALAEGRRPARMTEDEETLYDFCSEMLRNHKVSDATYARAFTRFGDRGLVDTVGIVGYYTMLAMTLNTFQTPAPPDAVPAPFPR